jgi:DNA-binding response OmpR family regulator
MPHPSILEANSVRLNLESREVVCDGVPIGLSPVEVDILEALMRSAGRVVSKSELLHALNAKRVNPFEANLDIQANQLKRKLERGRRIIRIVEGTGYLFTIADDHGASNYQLA